MDRRTTFTAVGAGITSFLLVAVAVIELLAFEFAAIVGLPVGLLVGVAVAGVLLVRGGRLRPAVGRTVTAYAAFGVAVLCLLVLRYVNVGRDVLTFDVVVGASLATVVVVYVALSLSDRDHGPE
ncbi:permease [Halapricum sp. CBA1109]|uniref:permease n=1 Tax=Halapricum sp. CBA1109 TaxID=2668068 RepID=UPI0012FB269E|nr:permease [Halapricum sp. CBA1109]MUV90505.1 permease [Halapricum sp. CBA1109]